MWNWLIGKFLGAGNWAFRQDIEKLSTQLLVLDRIELGNVVLASIKIRHDINQQTGANLLNPEDVWLSHPNLASTLAHTISSYPDAGVMKYMNLGARIWLFTLRGLSPLSNLQTKTATKKIWMALMPSIQDIREVRNAEIERDGQSDIPADFDMLPRGI